MSDCHPDVVIHIDENLDTHALEALERQVGLQPGVVSACIHEHRRHLLVVEYEHDDIDAQALLHAVRDQGVHAELIGL